MESGTGFREMLDSTLDGKEYKSLKDALVDCIIQFVIYHFPTSGQYTIRCEKSADEMLIFIVHNSETLGTLTLVPVEESYSRVYSLWDSCWCTAGNLRRLRVSVDCN